MAIKKFGWNENTPYTGTTGDDLIIGNNLSNTLNGNGGKDKIFGFGGNDNITGGADDDYFDGGAGVDVIVGGGSTAGNETVAGDVYYVTSNDTLTGDEGNDTFVIDGCSSTKGVVIDGGTSKLDNAGNAARFVDVDGFTNDTTGASGFTGTDVTTGITGDLTGPTVLTTRANAELAETDVRLNIATRPGSTALSTFVTSIAGYNAVDTIEFKKSGDYKDLQFSNIERIELASGVSIKLAANAITDNGESLDRGFLNPGVQVFGVAGGKAENVTLVFDYEDTTFTPAATVIGASPTTYNAGELQLDDYSVADIYHNVNVLYDAQSSSSANSYVRIDGSNSSETVWGSNGSDNATMRLGDDTYYGNGGHDLIVGHGGADYLDGGKGNDVFTVGGFGSGNQGTSSKADDGAPEWIATGAKHDTVVGGSGIDTFRVTTGIGATNSTTGKIVLNDANFKSMEVVQVGGTAGRLNTEDAGMQLMNEHYYFRANSSVADTSTAAGNNGGSINNVVIDASGVTKNGLRFEGNANVNTFIGTAKNDVFVGNGGNDVLTGGAGKDTFVFGKVYEQIVSGAATAPQTYINTAFNLTGKDTIADFTSGTDKIQLNLDQFSNLLGFGTGNIVSGAGAVAADANDYLIFNATTNTLSYDADGNGAGAAVDIAVLTGVNALSATDILIA